MVEQRGLWTLADDLEYALEHRDVEGLVRLRSRVVGAGGTPHDARAARSPLARAAAGRRDSPTGCASCRCSSSRSVDELFRIAGTGPSGAARVGTGPLRGGQASRPICEFLLDGAVTRVVTMAPPPTTIAAPAALGFEEVFENVPQRATIKASGIAICLSLAERPVPEPAVGEHGSRAWNLPAAARDARRRPMAARAHWRRATTGGGALQGRPRTH